MPIRWKPYLVNSANTIGSHARIQDFFQGGGGGGSLPDGQKQSGQRFCFCFLVFNSFCSLQRGSNGTITEKTIPF